MSAKGRGHETEAEEFYPTSPEVVFALLESDLVKLPGGIWIEPCAGTGRIISTINSFYDAPLRPRIDWIICELQEQFDPYLRELARPNRDTIIPYGDFVHREWTWPRADVLIMNPPFTLTMDFVKAGLERADYVVCLQRQGWFGTKYRASWLTWTCPDMFQLPWRPSFRPDGKTDNCEYCWYVWPPNADLGRREGRLAMLERPRGGQLGLF
jgi:hypothetical protein